MEAMPISNIHVRQAGKGILFDFESISIDYK